MSTETTGIDGFRQGGRFLGAPKRGPLLHTIFGPLKDVPQLGHRFGGLFLAPKAAPVLGRPLGRSERGVCARVAAI